MKLKESKIWNFDFYKMGIEKIMEEAHKTNSIGFLSSINFKMLQIFYNRTS